MNPVLEDITSIINGFSNAKDKERVFTYIEFVKMFGYDNDTNIFISAYKDYVTQWAIVKKDSITLSDNDFVMSKMVEVLKSITLDYSSYEEQDFIAHIDLTNKDHLKGLTAFYSKKIREITEFYRKKRNESVLIVNRNSMKGSVKSIQEIIYEKVFDFIFSNRNIVPSYKNIKRDLLISIENYVDTYSEYFDIPRKKEFTDKSRRDMLSANINDVDYRVYIEIQLVISEILFSGNVFLEEIPLIAQVGADLSQSCVGDMLMLKNQLVANTTVNQVDLDEQVALKRKLYEKFLGCNLYYMYVDLQGNVKIDVLCNAKNPSGNLLNVGTADTATTENEQLELLSHIGLFFKPDKTSILKVNAKDYTWSVDTDVIQNDTVYIFPDPNKYGDIGNNKNNSYPLIMEYKVGYDVKNMSSGAACNDPIKFLSDQGWHSYYSKQDDDFKLFDNKNYDYAFTWLANKGYVSNYQVDVWGNQFGILKGCKVEYKTDKNGNKVSVSKITLNPKYNETFIKNETVDVSNSEPKILNGGYFENPFYKGQLKTIEREKWKDDASKVPFQVIYDDELKTWRRKKTNEDDTNVWCRVIRNDVTEAEIKKVDGNNPTNYVKYKEITFKWVNSGAEENAKPFDYTKQMTLINNADDKYLWSGLRIDNKGFYFSDINTNFVSFGNFGNYEGIIYKDHFEKSFSEYDELEKDDSIITDVVLEFLTNNMYESSEIEIIEEDKDFFEMREESGEFYVKLCGKLGTKPILFSEAFPWVEFRDNELIKNFSIIYQTVVVETNERYIFIPYDYDGEKIVNTLGIREMYSIEKYKTIISNNTEIKVDYLQTNLLFNEVTRSFYILAIEDLVYNQRRFLIPRFFEFDCINYKMKEVINFYESVCKEQWVEEQIDRISLFSEYLKKKDTISYNKIEEFKKLLDTIDDNNQYFNLGNFEIPYYPITKQELKKVSFSYNSNLGLYLLSFILFDKNETPYIHEHKFKLIDLDNFNASLVSNVYTLKNVGDSYKWNDIVSAKKVSTIPYNEKNITDNTIWESYDGQGNSNEGFGDTSFNVDFSKEDFDNNTNSSYKSWKSMVYEGSEFEYTLKSNRKVTGKIDFENSCKIIKQGINSFKINYQNLVLTRKEDDAVSSIKLSTVGGSSFGFDVYCDIFGNISGNSTVKLKGINITDEKRQVIGVARLSIGGTIENYKLDVIVTIWDVYDNGNFINIDKSFKNEVDYEVKVDGVTENYEAKGIISLFGDILDVGNNTLTVSLRDGLLNDVDNFYMLNENFEVTVTENGNFITKSQTYDVFGERVSGSITITISGTIYQPNVDVSSILNYNPIKYYVFNGSTNISTLLTENNTTKTLEGTILSTLEGFEGDNIMNVNYYAFVTEDDGTQIEFKENVNALESEEEFPSFGIKKEILVTINEDGSLTPQYSILPLNLLGSLENGDYTLIGDIRIGLNADKTNLTFTSDSLSLSFEPKAISIQESYKWTDFVSNDSINGGFDVDVQGFNGQTGTITLTLDLTKYGDLLIEPVDGVNPIIISDIPIDKYGNMSEQSVSVHLSKEADNVTYTLQGDVIIKLVDGNLEVSTSNLQVVVNDKNINVNGSYKWTDFNISGLNGHTISGGFNVNVNGIRGNNGNSALTIHQTTIDNIIVNINSVIPKPIYIYENGDSSNVSHNVKLTKKVDNVTYTLQGDILIKLVSGNLDVSISNLQVVVDDANVNVNESRNWTDFNISGLNGHTINGGFDVTGEGIEGQEMTIRVSLDNITIDNEVNISPDQKNIDIVVIPDENGNFNAQNVEFNYYNETDEFTHSLNGTISISKDKTVKITSSNIVLNVTEIISYVDYDEDGNVVDYNVSTLSNGTGVFSGRTNLSTFTSDLSNLTDGSRMFQECGNLTTFTSDLSSLVNGSNMFNNCRNLTTFSGDSSGSPVNLSSLTNGTNMFWACDNLTSFTSDLSSLTNGSWMFYGCDNLTTFTSDLSSLVDGRDMFSLTPLESFSRDLSSLVNGSHMFYGCNNLTSFTSDLSSLTNGYHMFWSCGNLTTFTSDLSSLTNGDRMFSSCKLNKESVTNIINCLKNSNTCTWNSGSLTLGIDASLETDTELQTLLGITEGATSTTIIGHGGCTWTIKLQWN